MVVNSHGRDGWDDVDAGCQLPSDHPPASERASERERGEGGRWRLEQGAEFVSHLASSLATVSLGQVMKAAEWVPDVYVSDAMEKVLKPRVLSSWNINTLASSVWRAENLSMVSGLLAQSVLVHLKNLTCSHNI